MPHYKQRASRILYDANIFDHLHILLLELWYMYVAYSVGYLNDALYMNE